MSTPPQQLTGPYYREYITFPRLSRSPERARMFSHITKQVLKNIDDSLTDHAVLFHEAPPSLRGLDDDDFTDMPSLIETEEDKPGTGTTKKEEEEKLNK